MTSYWSRSAPARNRFNNARLVGFEKHLDNLQFTYTATLSIFIPIINQDGRSGNNQVQKQND